MKIISRFALAAVATFITSFAVAAGVATDASVVLLRTSCNDGAGGTLNNCFTTTSGVKQWIVNTRSPKPSASAPLIVEVGPGTFDRFALTCNSALPGFITIHGSGSDRTAIISSSGTYSPMDLTDCTGMAFQDLTVGPTSGDGILNGGTIEWRGTGSSTWHNVVVVTDDVYGWQESPGSSCSPTSRGSHFWFSSRFLAVDGGNGLRPYIAGCSENRFFGSEITIKSENLASYTEAWALIATAVTSEINFYGGAIRIIAPAGAAATTFDPVQLNGGMAAAVALNGAQIHIHGTGIDVISTDGDPIYALIAMNGSEIHADMSAYNLRTGSGGSVTRILNAGNSHIHAPYTWQHIPEPSTMPNFTSVNGADTTTFTPSGGHPRVVVYSATCVSTTSAATPWWDSVDSVCR